MSEQKFKENPGDIVAFRELEHLYQSQSQWEKLAEIYQRRGEFLKDLDMRESADLLLKSGRIYQHQLHDCARAYQGYLRAFETDMENDEIFAALEDCCLESSRWQDMFQIYYERLEIVEERKSRLALLNKTAHLCEHHLNQPDQAISFYNRARELDPKNLDILRQLATLYENQNQSGSAIEAYQTLLKMADSVESRDRTNLKIGTLWEKLGDRERAASFYRIINGNELQKEALSHLENIYRDRPMDLALILTERLESVKDTDEKVKLYKRLATLQDNREAAIAFYQRALEIVSDDLEVLREVSRIFWEKGQVDIWYEYQMRMVEHMKSTGEKAELLREACEKLRDREDSDELLIKLYEMLLKNSPHDRLAIEDLIVLYREHRDYEALLQVLRHKAKHCSLAERVSTYSQIAKLLFESLHQEEEAKNYYQKVLELQDDHQQTLDELKGQYFKKGNYQELLDILRRKIELEPGRASQYYQEIGEIYRDRVQNADKAIEAFENAISSDPRFAPGFNALLPMLKSKSQWDKYLRVAEDGLLLLKDQQQAIALHLDMAEIYAKQEKGHNVEEHLLMILRFNPAHSLALEKLKNLYYQQNRWENYAEILENSARFTATLEDLPGCYLEIARVYRDKLRHNGHALFFYEKAHYLNPFWQEAILEMQEIAEKIGDETKVIYCLTQRSNICAGKEQASLLRQLGNIFIKQQKIDKAIDAYEQALNITPYNLEVIDHLIVLYEGKRDSARLLLLLERKAELIDDREELKKIYQKSAQLALELNQSHSAISHLEKMLVISPEEDEISEKLIALYRQEKMWPALLLIYHHKLIKHTDRDLQILREMAKIYEEYIRDQWELQQVYRKILEIIPSDQLTLTALQELCRKSDDWQGLITAYEQEVNFCQNEMRLMELYQEMGLIYYTYLPELDKAIFCYNKVLQYDPDNYETLKNLHHLYLIKHDYPQAIEMIDRELKLLADPELEAHLLVEKGVIYRDRLHNLENATTAFEEALLRCPILLEPIEALENIFYREGRYAALLKLFETKQALLPQEESLNLQVEMARIYSILQDDTRAEHYLQNVLRQKPTHLEAQQRLVAFYHKEQNWEKLQQLYRQQIDKLPPGKERASVLFQLGKLYEEKLKNDEEAAALYVQVVNIEPTNLSAIKSLQKIYEKQNKLSSLIEAYMAELAADISMKRRGTLHLTCAELFDKSLNNKELAITHYQKALKLDPDNLYAIRKLQNLYRSQNDHDNLPQLLLAELAIEKDSNLLVKLHMELAEIYLVDNNNPEEALKHLIQAYNYRPQDIQILRKLKEILYEKGHWEQYIEYVQEELQRCEIDREKNKIHLQLSSIYEEKLGDVNKATSHLEIILESEKQDVTYLQRLQHLYEKQGSGQNTSRLIEMYEREKALTSDKSRICELCMLLANLYERWKNLDKAAQYWEEILKLDPYRHEIYGFLIRIYMKLENWEKLAQTLFANARLIQDITEKEKILNKVGNIYEKKLKDARAIGYYQMVLTLNPRNLTALQGIRRTAEHRKDWRTILDILYKEAQLGSDEQRATVYLKIAKIWETQMNLINQAVEAYLEVLKIQFHHPTAEYVLSLLSSIKDYETFCNLTQKVARRTQDPVIKAERLCELGRALFYELKRPSKAIEAYEGALKCSPKKVEAISGLEQIYESQEEWQKLAKCKESKLDIINNRNEIRKIHLELGRIFQERLFDEKKAIFHYERVLELNHQDLAVMHILQELYREWGYFQKYIDLCEKEIRMTDKVERKIDLYLDVAKTWEEKLFNQERAAQACEKILELNAMDSRAIAQLIPLYEKTENYRLLVSLYEIRLKEAREQGNTELCLSLEMLMAKIICEKLKDYDRAEKMYREILSQKPNDQYALAGLTIIFQHTEDRRQLAEILSLKIRTAQDAIEKAQLYYQLGEFYEKQEENIDKAIEAYQDAHALAPQKFEISQSLQKLYRHVGNVQALIEVNVELASGTDNARKQVSLYWEIATLLKDNDPQKSVTYLEKILQLQPSYIEAISLLADLLEHQQKWADLEKVLGIWIDNEIIHPKQSKLLVRRGILYRDFLKDINRALADFTAAFQKDQSYLPALIYLANLHWDLRQLEQAQSLYEQIVNWPVKEQLASMGHTDEIYFRWGKLAEELQKPQIALLRYQKTLEVMPDYLPVLRALGNIYYQNQQWEQALLIYMKVNVLKLSEQEQAEVQLRLSVIKEKMGMTQGAIEGYARVLEENPNDALALESLGTLYWERKDEGKAREYLLRLREISPEPASKKRAVLMLAKICESLDETGNAISFYQELLQLGDLSKENMKKLIVLYSKDGKWDDAFQCCQRVFSMPLSDVEKSEIEVIIGNIKWRGYRDRDGAFSSFEAALEKIPTYLPAIYAMVEIYKTLEMWEPLIELYQKCMERFPDYAKDQKIPLLLAQAKILEENLGRLREAIPIYEKILDIDPEHSGSHAALSTLWAKYPEKRVDAINEHHYLIMEDPFRIVSYHELFQLYLDQKEYDLSYRCVQALKAMDKLLPSEAEFMEQIPLRIPSGWLDPWTLDQLIKEASRGTLYEIMKEIDPYTEKCYVPSLEEKYQLRRKDKIALDSNRQIASFVHNTLGLLGIRDISLYISENDMTILENTQPPSLIIGRSWLEKLNAPQLQFIVGYYLFYVSRNQVMAGKFTEPEYRSYVVRLVDGFADTGKKLSAQEDAISRKLRFSLPRKIRKQLEERMDILTEIYQSDIGSFLRNLEIAAAKFGLLCCDSLKDAITAYLTIKKRTDLKFPEELVKIEELKELFWFNISDEYNRLRTELGLVVKWIK